MAFGTADRLKWDVAEGAALVLGRLAVRRAGRVALMTFGAGRPRLVPPRASKPGVIALRRALAEGCAPDGRPDRHALADALRRSGKVATQAGLVVLISDFRDEDDWTRRSGALRARHSVLAVEVGDPREASIPAVGRLSLVDPESGERVEVDTSRRRVRERFAALEAERRALVARELRRLEVEHVTLSTEGDWLQELGEATAMSFASPLLLLALLLVPLALAAQVASRRRARRYAVRFPAAATLALAAGRTPAWRRRLPIALLLAVDRGARARARQAAADGRGAGRAGVDHARDRPLALDDGRGRRPDAAGGGQARGAHVPRPAPARRARRRDDVLRRARRHAGPDARPRARAADGRRADRRRRDRHRRRAAGRARHARARAQGHRRQTPAVGDRAAVRRHDDDRPRPGRRRRNRALS